ncbi:hypothetical protein [Acinetobacter dispersus]|uniref:Uncharacterized protein n=1 Tax=Acinetobacter dispersus TaxID=70348 RepID=N9L8Z1_9GAMM|nr:hypothetical protein [Acinetobacter dispersus]ENW92742.1 hypothetical protein F904_02685 [Acinetobacter dispersus]
MATAANTAKPVSLEEAELISWFNSQVQNLNYKGRPVEKLNLSYDQKDGYSILLEFGNPVADEQPA